MIILGIDPGATHSGWVIFGETIPYCCGHWVNTDLLSMIYMPDVRIDAVAIEMLTGYGIVSGDDTFQTCRWVGRLEQAAMSSKHVTGEVKLISRKEIKRHLCGNTTTNDKYVRQALIDRFGEVGTKKKPGPLFGISGHCWSALAVAVTAADQIEAKG